VHEFNPLQVYYLSLCKEGAGSASLKITDMRVDLGGRRIIKKKTVFVIISSCHIK
jgi:hypothetical protein